MAQDDPPSGLPVFTSTANKRRSLLLPKGTVSAAVQRGASAKNAAVKPRPMSMFGLGSISSEDLEALAGTGSRSRPRADTSGRLQGLEEEPAETATNTTGMAQTKQTSRIARSQSLQKPAVGMATLSYARNESTAPGSGLKLMPKLTESTVVSQTSRPGSSASTTHSPTDSEPSKSKSRLPGPQSASNGLRRPNTTTSKHTRTASALPTLSSAPVLPTSRLTQHSLNPRPTFNTHQQHFSPRKTAAPKPPSSSLIHASPVDQFSTLSLETQLLQAYLLQLCLLHTSFFPTYVSWCQSTRREMRATFTEVATRAELVAERESELRQRKNVAVLLAWGNGPEHGLGENIQTLAELVQEASVMGEGTGRVRRCVEEFETWIGKVQEIWAVRDTRLAVVEGLGEVWRAESKGLVRRVKGLMRILEGLERPNEADCTLAEVMTGVEELFRGMLEELVAVVSIERTIMDKEKHWIDEQLQQLGLGGGENETAMRITN